MDVGVDVWDRDLMGSRPWPWLRTLIQGLLCADTRLSRSLSKDQDQGAEGTDGADPR